MFIGVKWSSDFWGAAGGSEIVLVGDAEALQVDARDIRQRMDADTQLGHSSAFIYRIAHAMAHAGDGGFPELTVDSPENSIVVFQPGSRCRRACAFRR